MAGVSTGAQQPTPSKRARQSPRLQGIDVAHLGALDRRLLDEFQRDFPLCQQPYAEMARRVGSDEATVIERLAWLQREGYVSRVGPVFRPNRLGASTLAAMAVPAAMLEEVAGIVSSFDEVNHNYEREHRFNLWFVVVADDEQQLQDVLAEIEDSCGYPVLDLPLLNEHFIDLGFDLWT